MKEALRRAVHSWKVKGTIQKLLSVVPGDDLINDRLQVSMGGLRGFEKNVAAKVDDWVLLV
jgi:hypothetical protein